MTSVGPQTCPVCKVKIIPCGVMGDRVEFAFGAPGTREVLWQRVCRHAQKPGCINQASGGGPIKPMPI